MASEDTGYLDGYIPATKDRLNKAIKELQKELKRVEKKSGNREQRISKLGQELWDKIVKFESELQKFDERINSTRTIQLIQGAKVGNIERINRILESKMADIEERIKNLPSGEGKEEKTDATSKQRLLLL